MHHKKKFEVASGEMGIGTQRWRVGQFVLVLLAGATIGIGLLAGFDIVVRGYDKFASQTYDRDASWSKIRSDRGPAASNEKLGRISEAVRDLGHSVCIAKIEKVSRFFSFGDGDSAMIIPGSELNRNGGILSFMMRVSDSVVIADFAPGVNETCDASYAATVFWPVGCEAVFRTEFQGLTVIDQSSDSLFLQGQDRMYVFLVTAGTGCLSVKKEPVH